MEELLCDKHPFSKALHMCVSCTKVMCEVCTVRTQSMTYCTDCRPGFEYVNPTLPSQRKMAVITTVGLLTLVLPPLTLFGLIVFAIWLIQHYRR
jgi:hypothetical protein